MIGTTNKLAREWPAFSLMASGSRGRGTLVTLLAIVATISAIGVMALAVSSAGRVSASGWQAQAGVATQVGSTASATPTCVPDWSLQSSPNVGSGTNRLVGVAALTANDVWAIGSYIDATSGRERSLIQHWDGSTWQVVPSPQVGVSTSLKGISAIAPDDVWAVGSYSEMNTVSTLTIHWDGSQWGVVSSPNRGTRTNVLRAVSALSPTDVWAVGYYYSTSGARNYTLTMRWNGIEWATMNSPNGDFQHDNYLNGVAAVAPDDVWAVGNYFSSNGAAQRTLIVRWNGSTWARVASPNRGTTYDNYLNAVTAVSSNDVWAVGSFNNGSAPSDPLTMRWNGTQWSLVSAPRSSSFGNYLSGVTATASDDVWAVGYTGGPSQSYILRWDGSAWSLFPSPNMTYSYNYLRAVSATGTGEVWAVGEFNSSEVIRTLTMRHPGEGCAFPTPTLTPTPTATPACGTHWRAGPPIRDGHITDIEVVSASDIWAVGSYYGQTSTGTALRTLIMRWDGAEWQVVPSPNASTFNNHLHAISASSANDAWAVGYYYGSTPSAFASLVLRWNGSTWSVVNTSDGPAPKSPLDFGTSLVDVEALAPNNVWTVGYSTDGYLSDAMIYHWNGSQWGYWVVAEGGLSQVSALSATDIWAVGTRSGGRTLTVHWDGSHWTVVASPNMNTDYNSLLAVTTLSPTNVWAVGAYADNYLPQRTLAMRWDGTQWSIVPSPNMGAGSNYLDDISALSTNDIWAAGSYQPGGSGWMTLVQRWDGTQWSIVPSPNRAPQYNYLNSLAAVSPNNVWAGGASHDLGATTLMLRYSEVPCVSTATPTYTATPMGTGTRTYTATLTRTATPTHTITTPTHTVTTPTRTVVLTHTSTPTTAASPTGTVMPSLTSTATPTRTPPLPSSTPAPTLIPATSTMVSNTATATVGAGSPSATVGVATVTITACAVSFRDIPSTHTFYASIRCLVCKGTVSGYADGTFKPDNLVTRGQLAKIVSNAANFQENPGVQIFQDVPTDHTFYEWINRLTNRGYMSGYTCGSPGEPCVNNRPYFRPFANATRAQTSKIVSNAATYNDPPTGQTFEDVPPTNPFYVEIQRLASRNIMGGYNCGGPGEPCVNNRPYFRPYNNVTRGQSSKIVANTFYPNCEILVRP